MDPLTIGNLTVDPPLILAPLAGITNQPFRVVCRRGGAGAVWTEMISARAIHFGDRRTGQMCQFQREEGPVAAQIFGREPGEVAAAARYAADRGADIIDINMGCPVKKILKSGSGVQLMREPELAVRIIAAAAAAVKVPVSVKIRLGWSEEEINCVELGRELAGAGAAAVTLHPRTRVQGFTGSARWEYITLLKEALDIPVIGSGDVSDAASARRMFTSTGCDALMVGRGALGRPWIFASIAGELGGAVPSPMPDRRQLIRDHVSLLVGQLPGHRSVGHLRKHLAWYSKGMPEGASFRRAVNAIGEPERIVATAVEFFEL